MDLNVHKTIYLVQQNIYVKLSDEIFTFYLKEGFFSDFRLDKRKFDHFVIKSEIMKGN